MKNKLLITTFLLLFMGVFPLFAQLVITAPNGGETWTAGSSQNITWTNAGAGTNVTLEYWDGTTWQPIATPVVSVNGPNSYSWNPIPNSPTVAALVRITEVGVPANTDVSDAVFTLGGVTLTSPVGGESWTAGSSHNITWTSQLIANVKLEYSTNGGGAWTTIIASTAAAGGSYAWNPIPNANTTNAKVRVSDVLDATVNSVSPVAFTIVPVAPTPSTPVNGLTGVSILPTLTWTAVPGASSYTIYLDDDIAFGSMNFSNNVGNFLTYTFDATMPTFPLINATLYYWKVTATISGVEGPASTVFHFTTTPDIVPTLYNPADASTNYGTSVLFSWVTGTSTTGLKFKVQWYQKDSGNPTETQWAGASSYTTTSLTYTKTGLLAGKRYCWRVIVLRSSNDDVLDYSAVQSFTNSGGATVTVYPSWPTGGATVYTNSPTLYWYLDQYATGLKYQVRYVSEVDNPSGATTGDSLDAGTDYPTYGSSGSSNLYLTLSSLTPGKTYYWQVRAYYSAANLYSAWSSVASFVANGSGTLQVPIPSYPTGGVTVYTTAPTLYWYLPTAATGLYYEIDYGITTAGGDGIPDFQTTTVDQLYKQITGLTPGQTYYYKIRSKNVTTFPATVVGTYSNWSESAPVTNATFTVAGGTTASYAVASYPIGNPTVYTNTPTLYWYLEGSSLGISSYVVKYKKNAAPVNWTGALGGPNADEGQYTGLSSSTYSKQITVDLTYGATYYWAVYATGTSDPINPLGVGSFTVVGGSGGASVVLSQPENGSTVYNTSVTFYWYVNGSTAGLQSYTLQYSQSDMHTPYTEVTSIANQYRTISGLTNGATYYWRVGAVYNDGTVWASPWYSFTVNTGSPSIVQPLVGSPNNVTVNTTSPMLSWVLPAKAAANSSYEVQLADNPNFTSAKTFSSNKSYLSVNGLDGGKGYFWKVRSTDGTGNASYYSGTGQFKVNNSITAVEEKEVIPTSFELSQNYPNPFNPTTKIRYALPQNAYVSIKIYDMLGREVRSLVNNEMAAGNHSVEWSGDDNSGNRVSSGAYIYRITATAQAGQAGNPSAGSGQGFISTKKMIMLK